MKVAIIFVNIGSYHLERVKAAANVLQANGHELVLFELTADTLDHPWQIKHNGHNFEWITLLNGNSNYRKSTFQLIANLNKSLSNLQIDLLVISGYYNLVMLSALLWCFRYKQPAILLSESKDDDVLRSWWKERLKKLLVKGYKAALVGGKPHKRYLIQLGMVPDSIFLGYDVVGNAIFNPVRIKSLTNPLSRPYFLTINRFIPKKNLLFLISAYANYRQAAGENAWDLILCGDGKMRFEIEQQISKLKLGDSVYLPGFLQQDELLPYFAHAGCFIHASTHEQWGLVVNEAMAAGLPVLVSNRCGCFEDLVIEGVNGFSFDPYDSQQLTNLMLRVSSGEINLENIGQAALEHIQKFSPDYFAQGLLEAVEYALANN